MKLNNLQGENVFKPIPGNNPVSVENTTLSPYCYVGLLLVTFPNRQTYVGTATLIGKMSGDKESIHVLTCAHNLYSKNDGGMAVTVRFQRAFNDPDAPYEPIEAEKWSFPDAYPDTDLPNDLPSRFIDERLIEANVALDYAVVKLKKAIRTEQSLPFVQVKTTEDLMYKQIQINSYGWYNEAMAHAQGPIKEVAAQRLFYPISTRSGAAGAAIMNRDSLEIYGIHTRETDRDLNQGVRITDSVKNEILSWME